VVEHASYVVFEDIFLILGCRINVKEMLDRAARQVELELASGELEQEKLGVERRIESAVRESEIQKRYLSESVTAVLEKMEQFAEGDLRVRLEKGKEGEIGRLFEGFNQAVENTGRLLSQVTEAVNTVANAANQINSSTEDLEATTQQQSSRTLTVTSEVGQMALASTDGAKLGLLTAQAATESGDTAKQGQAIVEQSTSKMGRIADVVRTSAQTVEELGKSSEEIGKIVSVIDDIADRTNLLALNAAIEAARAGQHGLGFAVVADEVRQLAERTREATSQIYDMITSVQVETNRAVKAMAVGTGEVDEGILLSQRTADALTQIVHKTQGMIERVNQIAVVCDQQASSNLRVSENVKQISDMSSRSAEGVSQISNAASRLNELTERLRSLTSRFKLDASASDGLEMWGESGSMFRAERRSPSHSPHV
jgi:methyl-accepting chemotaxis protein